MIQGAVSASREAVIALTVFAADGTSEVIDAVVDTGFTDFLTLPSQTITRLNLTPAAPVRGRLADGSIIDVMLYRALVLWDDLERAVLVVEAEGKTLVGMSLLYGYDLWMRTVDGGEVKITKSSG